MSYYRLLLGQLYMVYSSVKESVAVDLIQFGECRGVPESEMELGNFNFKLLGGNHGPGSVRSQKGKSLLIVAEKWSIHYNSHFFSYNASKT